MAGISSALESPEEATSILRELKTAEKMNRKVLEKIKLDAGWHAERLSGFQFAQVDAAEHTKLKVRVELEVERRMRIQSALDSAEKRCYASNRLLEKKVRCVKCPTTSNSESRIKLDDTHTFDTTLSAGSWKTGSRRGRPRARTWKRA